MNKVRKIASVPVWSDHWPTTNLRIEQEEKPRYFKRGFQQIAFDDSERMFPSFTNCYTPGVIASEISRRGWPTFIGVDLAGEKRKGTVLFVIALDPSTQRRYPVEILVGNWTSPETARKLAELCQRHVQVRHIIVENNAYQQALIDWIKNSPTDHSFWYKIEGYTTGQKTKIDEMVGLPSLEIEFSKKAWVIPLQEFEGHKPTCPCGWCVWTSQMKDYPMSSATDTVMACIFAREAIHKYGGINQNSLRVGAGFNIR